MKTKQELMYALENADSDVINSFFSAELDHEDEDFGDFPFRLEENYGGEGDGEECYSVYSFDTSDGKIYIKFNGWYQSYHGSEFTEYFEVLPFQETITVYRMK